VNPDEFPRPGRIPIMSVPVNATWEMVAYAFVKELPALVGILSGAVFGVILISRSPQSSLEALGSVVLPGIVGALARSKPAGKD
jgi:hypothetical protein